MIVVSGTVKLEVSNQSTYNRYMGKDRRDKINYYLDLAEVVAQRGTCLRRNYGAVIVKNDEVISSGYVGAPRGRQNCSDMGVCIREKMMIPRGERYELCRSVHAEMNAIIDSIVNPKHKAQIVLLYSSGMRVGEMCPLHCHDIHRKEKHIYIAHGKNGSNRNAILADRAVKDLITYIHECYKGAQPKDWLFPGQFPGTHVCEQTVANIFAQALARVGLADKGYTLHSLRHAFGLHLYDAGYNLMEIKEAMGHKSLSSTVVYLSLGIGNGRIVKSPYDFD